MPLFSFGKSKSRSSSQASASSLSTSSTDQSVFLEDVFARLFSGAENAVANFATQPITSAAGSLFDTGTSLVSSLSGGPGGIVAEGGVGDVAPIGLTGSTVDDEIALLQEDLGRLFSEEINPAITSEAVAGGTLGGGRQGVAQAQAARGIAGEFVRGATDIRSRDIARQLEVQRTNQQAALQREQLAVADRARIQEGRTAEASLGIQGASTALSMLPSLLGLQQTGAQAELMPFLALAQILGGPTVLTEQRSRSESESQQSSTSTASSFNFGLGFGGG